MAVNVASITGKVLIQIADGEPVEVGTIEIPIYAGTEHPKATRGREIGTATVSIAPDVDLTAATEGIKRAMGRDEALRGA